MSLGQLTANYTDSEGEESHSSNEEMQQSRQSSNRATTDNSPNVVQTPKKVSLIRIFLLIIKT